MAHWAQTRSGGYEWSASPLTAQRALARRSLDGTQADEGTQKSWHGHMTFTDLEERAWVSYRTAPARAKKKDELSCTPGWRITLLPDPAGVSCLMANPGRHGS